MIYRLYIKMVSERGEQLDVLLSATVTKNRLRELLYFVNCESFLQTHHSIVIISYNAIKIESLSVSRV